MEKVKCIYSNGAEIEATLIDNFKIDDLDFQIYKGSTADKKNMLFVAHELVYLYDSISLCKKKESEQLKVLFMELFKKNSSKEQMEDFIVQIYKRKKELEK